MTGKPPAEKTLLHDITGVCAPGNLIALMGASGGVFLLTHCM